jgi:hypothetical protein
MSRHRRARRSLSPKVKSLEDMFDHLKESHPEAKLTLWLPTSSLEYLLKKLPADKIEQCDICIDENLPRASLYIFDGRERKPL